MSTHTVPRVQHTVEQIIVGYTCNQCGSHLDLPEGQPYNWHEQRYHSFKVGGGFATGFPGDMKSVEFVLCADCLRALVEGFKVPAAWENTWESECREVRHSETLELYTWYGRDIVGKASTYDELKNLYQSGVVEPPEDIECPDEEDRVTGLYLHYKGQYYQALRVVWNYSTREWGVIYRQLYGKGGYWFRPYSMFVDDVGEGRPRFKRLS
jgi:hypothetical protein